MPEIRQTKLLFDGADFLDSFIKTIFPKVLMLDLLELVTHLVIFLGGQRLLPGRKDDRIFSGGVIPVREHKEGFQTISTLNRS
jgi:hypothetical protein